MSVFNAYMSLLGSIDADVRRDERLAHRTTYRIGGPAALAVTAHTYRALVRTIEVLGEEGVPWVILGKGSNILASDEGYQGCVISLGREFCRVTISEDGIVAAGAGVALSKLLNDALRASLSGLEFCVGIPGTVGGAIAMDAGTRREWIGSLVRDVVTYRPGEGMIRYDGSEVEWGYRTTSIPKDEVILEATFCLQQGDRKAIGEAMDARLHLRHRNQPTGVASCGSVFKNPGEVSVARLIERCGLKGYTVGGATVSDVHANFVVNSGCATAADVVSVITHVHDVVSEQCGYDLTPEVRFLGF